MQTHPPGCFFQPRASIFWLLQQFPAARSLLPSHGAYRTAGSASRPSEETLRRPAASRRDGKMALDKRESRETPLLPLKATSAEILVPKEGGGAARQEVPLQGIAGTEPLTFPGLFSKEANCI